MLNKILLACCAKQALPSEFACRMRVVVGERTISSGLVVRGYAIDDIGTVSIDEQVGDWVLYRVITQGDDTGALTSFETSVQIASRNVLLVNESTGATALVSHRGTNIGHQYIAYVDLYEGVESGEACTIAVYV